jgi:hypothetical protein
MKRVNSQIQPTGPNMNPMDEMEEQQRKMRVLMYEWNLQQCFRVRCVTFVALPLLFCLEPKSSPARAKK